MQTGSWDDISGETFLRGLLSRGIEIAQYSVVSSEAIAAHAQDLLSLQRDTQFPQCQIRSAMIAKS